MKSARTGVVESAAVDWSVATWPIFSSLCSCEEHYCGNTVSAESSFQDTLHRF